VLQLISTSVFSVFDAVFHLLGHLLVYATCTCTSVLVLARVRDFTSIPVLARVYIYTSIRYSLVYAVLLVPVYVCNCTCALYVNVLVLCKLLYLSVH
jgi:hypothetical protein